MDVKNLDEKTALIVENTQDLSKKIALAKNIVLVLGFAILTGLSASLKVEIGFVPITMQTFVVLLSGALLGSKKGAASQASYLMLGLSGLPWFSRGGGMAYIMSPTFGYILGFVLAAYLTGLLFEKGWNKDIKTSILAITIANLAIYIPGLLWLARFVGFSKALIVGFYPFILGDILKISLVVLVLLLDSGYKKSKN